MPLSAELRSRMSQRFKMAPQMRQSLNMLQMSLPALRQELFNEMAVNPVIEEIEPTLERETVSHLERESEMEERSYDSDYTEDDDIPETSWTVDADAVERRQKFFDNQTVEETLEEHLMKQLEMSEIDPGDYSLAEILIGELDGNGFFNGSIPDIMMVSGESEEKIRKVLRQIGELDPAGCGATTPEECLMAQLDKLDGSPYQQEVREILERGHLRNIAKGMIAAVEKDLGMSHERYADVLEALRTLDPRPGRAFTKGGKSVTYINPEVHAVKGADGRWLAKVDDRSLPDVHISKKYLRMMENPSTDKETREYIRERIAAANLIIDSIEHRHDTIKAIAQAIFDAQPGFFTDGLKGLKPLTMQDIAKVVGVHHTTVSRTVHDKYASTPKGTVELRKFFNQGVETASGEMISRDGVLEKIKELIDGEDKSCPLSDDKISELLKEYGYKVARRTVAKYRGMINVPGAVERKNQ